LKTDFKELYARWPTLQGQSGSFKIRAGLPKSGRPKVAGDSADSHSNCFETFVHRLRRPAIDETSSGLSPVGRSDNSPGQAQRSPGSASNNRPRPVGTVRNQPKMHLFNEINNLQPRWRAVFFSPPTGFVDRQGMKLCPIHRTFLFLSDGWESVELHDDVLFR
jgi:hypothetical protein